jgi:hypothetical protein
MSEDGRVTERRLDLVPLGELRPHPQNPRTHKPAELRKSFDRFGYTNPIIVCERTGLMAAGHGRYELLMAMDEDGADPPEGVEVNDDHEWMVPVSRGWASKDDDELLAYVIADNRQTELGGWETAELVPVLTDLAEIDTGLAGTGFTPTDLAKMQTPAEPEKPQVASENSYGQRADLYRNKQVRSIVFDYPIEAWDFVGRACAALRPQYEAETNAELFVAMLREYEAEHPEAA